MARRPAAGATNCRTRRLDACDLAPFADAYAGRPHTPLDMRQLTHRPPRKLRVRRFHVSDAEEIVELFRGTVHNVNSRDYSDEQLEAWAPAQIDVKTWR